MSDDITVWFNPSCSKCRGARDLLDEQGVACEIVRYLEDTPARAEIERVLGLLGSDDPRVMMRTGEPVYRELGLADGRDEPLASSLRHAAEHCNRAPGETLRAARRHPARPHRPVQHCG